jgi:hypothetical protein
MSMSDNSREPPSRYQRSGEYDEFLLGIVGEADEHRERYVAVHTVTSKQDDPVGYVVLTGRFHGDGEDQRSRVILDGFEAAMLAAVLQDAARQWQEREMSHRWKEEPE